jgi:hypothetical protein
MKVRQLKDLFYDLAIMRVREEAVTPQTLYANEQ